MIGEFHDLPSTAMARDCWVNVHRGRFAITCQIYGTSKATGCDLPATCDVIWHDGSPANQDRVRASDREDA